MGIESPLCLKKLRLTASSHCYGAGNIAHSEGNMLK
jgi:hypothetical protein